MVRICGQLGLLLLYALMFFLAYRVDIDNATGMKQLLMSTPLRKTQYVLGKWAGSFLFIVTITFIYLSVHSMAYYLIEAPNSGGFFSAYIGVALLLLMPACFFVATMSIMLSLLTNAKICYVLFSLYVFFCMLTFGMETRNPFYQLTSGVLIDQIYDNPDLSTYPVFSIISNCLFLFVLPMLVFVAVMLRRKGWRYE